MLAAIARGIPLRPFRLLIAYLEKEDEKRFIQVYIADQLWAINRSAYKEWEYPHLMDILKGSNDEEVQKRRDEEEKKQVYEWLMGG